MDVSVIIPAYNRLWALPKAIESCLNTNCSTEIIVVDDGSTDGTWEWLVTQENLVKMHQLNQGQTYAVNAGMALASGKYIRFLDSDDFLEAGTIDKQFEMAEACGADLVYGKVDGWEAGTNTAIVYPDIIPWEDFMEVQLSNRYGSHFLGMLFRTDWARLVPRRPDFALREDRMFLLEYGLMNPKLAFVPGCMGYWVKHDGQMQGNYSGLQAQAANWQYLQIFKRILAALDKKGELNMERRKAAATSLWPLATWIGKNHPADAAKLYQWILELNPSFTPPEKGALGLFYRSLGFNTTQKILKLRRWLVGTA